MRYLFSVFSSVPLVLLWLDTAIWVYPPIASVPNIFSCKYTFLSMGVWLVLWHCLLILGQILILKHDFQPIQFLQLPLSFLFGAFTDFGLWCVSFIPVPNYFVKLCLVFCGVFVLACGVSLAVIANVILNCGEAFVKAIADKTGKNLAILKSSSMLVV